MFGCLGLDCFEGLGVVTPPCVWSPACNTAPADAARHRKRGDLFNAYGNDKLAKHYYDLADKASKMLDSRLCCKEGKGGPNYKEPPDWRVEREKYRMTPEELEKAKDVYRKGFEETKARYQSMIDAGESYHGMTPAQLRKWIYLDGPAKLEKRLKEMDQNPYHLIATTFGREISPAFSASRGAIPASALDFGIDKKTKQEPPRSWDPYKPTPTPPELTPAETPEPTPTPSPKPGCGTICTSALYNNSCVNTCTGERYKTDGKDRKITPASPASPAVTPSVRPTITPALKAKTTGRTAMLSGLGCIGLGCMGALTEDQKTKAAAMQNSLNNYLVRLRAYKATAAAADVEDAERILTNGVDKFWSDVNRDDNWDAALYTYRGLTKIAEDAIKVAQDKVPYSTPSQTVPPSQTRVGDTVFNQAIKQSQQVAQQSAAVQASFTPYTPAVQSIMDTWFPTPAALQPGPDALTKVGVMLATQRATEQAAQQAAKAKKTNTMLLVGAAVVGLGVLYFAFKSKD